MQHQAVGRKLHDHAVLVPKQISPCGSGEAAIEHLTRACFLVITQLAVANGASGADETRKVNGIAR